VDGQHWQGNTVTVDHTLVHQYRTAGHQCRLKAGATHINHDAVVLLVGPGIDQARTGSGSRP